MTAQWRLLTQYLRTSGPSVTLTWAELGGIVGGVPASATNHYPQWWHGDRTRAWRSAGYEATRIDPGVSVTFSRNDTTATTPMRPPNEHATHSSGAPPQPPSLAQVDPTQCLVIIPCSARKRLGGQSGNPAAADSELARARQRVLADGSQSDESLVMPAWRRYDGVFYRAAGSVLPDLAGSGRLLILSGGYGVLDARDEIGTYNRMMRLRDWPRGLLQQQLAHTASTAGRDVVAFASNTTDYARLLRSTPWRLPEGRRAQLLTLRGVRGVSAVSGALGEALCAFIMGSERFPTGVVVEELAG